MSSLYNNNSKLDRAILEYLRISEELDDKIESVEEEEMLESMIEMFNRSYKVSESWKNLDQNINLFKANFDHKDTVEGKNDKKHVSPGLDNNRTENFEIKNP
jgi:hypothetical protein